MLRIVAREAARNTKALSALTRPATARTMVHDTSSDNKDLSINKLFDVSKLTAVVTGGGTGIGLMITQALQSNGAKVYITGRRQDALEKVVEQYSTGPGKVIALPGDISSKEECQRLADEVAEKEDGGIHLLVNNVSAPRFA